MCADACLCINMKVGDCSNLYTVEAEALAEPRAHCFSQLAPRMPCLGLSHVGITVGPPLPSRFYVNSRALTPSSVCAASTLPIEQSPHSNLGFLYWLTYLSLPVDFGMGFRCTYVEQMFESLLLLGLAGSRSVS